MLLFLTGIPVFCCVQYMLSMDESQLKAKAIKTLDLLRNKLTFSKTFMLHKETKVLY